MLPMLAVATALASSPGVPETVFVFDAERSEVLVHTDRSGLFGFAGHRHVIRADELMGELAWPEGGIPTSIRLDIMTASLVVADDDLDSSTVAKVQHEMETAVLEVETHPRIEFGTSEVKRLDDEGRYKIRGRLTLHGTTREIEFPATLTRVGRIARLTAEIELKQKDYDIEPVSAGLGAVKVKNEVRITFDLLGASAPDGAIPEE